MTIETIPEFPTLFKLVSGTETQEWDVRVTANADGTASVIVTHGRQGGAKQVATDVIDKPKRGKATPLEQAISDAQGRWNEKLSRKGYGRTVEASGDVRSVSPMLAYSFEDYVQAVDWTKAWMQPKLDGYRCKAMQDAAGQVLLFSRENKPILTMPHIAAALAKLMQPGEMWDGELYTQDEAFENIGSLVKKLQPDSVKIQYHIYDQMGPEAFGDRYDVLMRRLRRGPTDILVPVETRIVTDPAELTVFQEACLAQGLEGAMLRHGDVGYQAGKRSKHLLKFKPCDDAEFEIIDVIACDRGSHRDVAKLICRAPNGNVFDVTAPGKMPEKRAILARHLSGEEKYVGCTLTVEYQGYTTTDKPVPRFPRAKKGRKINAAG